MQQSELYPIVLKLAAELNAENQLRLAEAMTSRKDDDETLVNYLRTCTVPAVGELKAVRIALRYKETEYRIHRDWPGFAKTQDFIITMNYLRDALETHPDGHHPQGLYNVWEANLNILIKRMIS